MNDVELRVKLTIDDLKKGVKAGQDELSKLRARVQVDLERDRYQAQITEIRSQLKALDTQVVTPEIEFNRQQLVTEIAEVESKLKILDNQVIDIDTKPAQQNAISLAQGFQVVGDATRQVTQTIVTEFAKATNSFAEFDSKVRQAGVISGASAADLGALREEITRLGIATSATPDQIAELAVNFSRAGFSAKEQVVALEGVVRASEASGDSIAIVSDIIAKSVRAFGLAADDTQKVADILVSTANNSNTSVSGIGESLTFLGATAKASNQSLDDVTILLGLLGDAGIQGSTAGTALAAALDRLKIASAGADTEFAGLVRGSAKLTEAYNQLSTSFRDSEGNLRPLLQILPELRSRLEGLSRQQDQDVLVRALFGVQGGNAFLTLLNRSQSDIDSLTNKVVNSSGVALASGEKLLQGLGGSLKLLEGSASTAQVAFGQFLGQGVEPAVRGATSLINVFLSAPKPVQDTAFAVTTLGGALVAGTGVLIAYNLAQQAGVIQSVAFALAETKKQVVLAATTVGTGAATLAKNAYALAVGKATVASTGLTASVVPLAAGLAGLATIAAGAAFVGYTVQITLANQALESLERASNNASDTSIKLAFSTKGVTQELANSNQVTTEQIAKAQQRLKINQDQIETERAEIEALKQTKTANDEQRNTLALLVAQREAGVKALETQNGKLKEAIDAQTKNTASTKESAEAQKTLAETIGELSAKYQQANTQIATSTQQRSTILLEEQAKGIRSESETQEKLKQLELEGLNQRIATANSLLPQLREALKATSKPEEIAQINQQIAQIESDSLTARTGVARMELEKRKQLEQDALSQIEQAQKTAISAAVAAEADRLLQVQELVNRGAITKEQAEQQSLLATQERIRAEIAAEQGRIAQLQALPNPNDPAQEQARAQQIEQIRTDISNKTRALLQSEFQLQEQLRAQAIEAETSGFEATKSALENQTKLIEQQTGLRQAQINLEETRNQALLSAVDLELQKTQQALELRQRLDSGSVTSAQERTLLEQRIGELGVSQGATQQEIQERIRQQTEARLTIERQGFEARQQAEQASLEAEIKRREIAAQIQQVEAQILQIKAQDPNSGISLANAQKIVDLANQNLQAIQQSAGIERESLAIKQQAERSQFEAAQQAERFDIALDRAAANTTKVSERTSSIKTNQQIAAEQAERQAIALARAADNAKRLDEAVKSAAEKVSSDLQNAISGVASTFDLINGEAGQLIGAVSAIAVKTADQIELRKQELDLLIQLEENDQKRAILEEEKKLLTRSQTQEKLKQVRAEAEANEELLRNIRFSNDGLAQFRDLNQQNINSLTTVESIQQRVATQTAQLASQFAQIPQQIGASADQANLLGDNISNALGGTQALASGFDRVTTSIQNAANASANLNRTGATPPGRAEGGAVLPTGYTVNERGQESVLDFKTGEVSLLPPGRRQIEFDNPGFVFTAQQTKEMFSRADGGLVLTKELSGLLGQAITVSGGENAFRFKGVLQNPNPTNVRDAINTANALKAQSSDRSGLPALFSNLEANLQGLLNQSANQVRPASTSRGSLLGNSSGNPNSSRSGGSSLSGGGRSELNAPRNDQSPSLASRSNNSSVQGFNLSGISNSIAFNPQNVSQPIQNVPQAIQISTSPINFGGSEKPRNISGNSANSTDIERIINRYNIVFRNALTEAGAILPDASNIGDIKIALEKAKTAPDIFFSGGVTKANGKLGFGGTKGSVLAQRLGGFVEELKSLKIKLPAFADGGTFNISPSNSFIAGERGAELITLDGRGGARIFNASETKQMLKGFSPKLPGFQTGGTFQPRSASDGGMAEVVQNLKDLIRSAQETTQSVRGLNDKLDRPNVTVQSVEPPTKVIREVLVSETKRRINSNA